jgi:CubicO group peptidase (beta-lactamase class C family)
VLIVAPTLARAQADDAAAMIARIEAPQHPSRGGLDAMTLQQVMAKFHVPGVSVAVIRDFKVHWTRAYGVADQETGRPVNDRTLFQAASISKPLTAMAVLALVQRGQLDLDRDVNGYLRSWHVPASQLTSTQSVTLRALLSHTSGSDDGFGFPGYQPGAPRPALVQILEGQPPSNVGPVRFVRPPYQAYKYSGGGIVIVQQLLADVTSRPFADFLRTMVLEPLGMTGSSFEQPLPDSLAVLAARAHDGQGRVMEVPWHVYPEQAAAGLWTTPSDLARFLIEVQHGLSGQPTRVLSRQSVMEMVTPVGAGPFGVGLIVQRTGQGWYFNHSGGNWGFGADLLGHFRKGYGVVIMTNGEGGGPLIEEIEARVAAAYGWDSLDKPLVR